MKVVEEGLSITMTPIDFLEWEVVEKIKWSGNIVYQYSFPNSELLNEECNALILMITDKQINNKRCKVFCCRVWGKEERYYDFTEQGYTNACIEIERKRLEILCALASGKVIKEIDNEQE